MSELNSKNGLTQKEKLLKKNTIIFIILFIIATAILIIEFIAGPTIILFIISLSLYFIDIVGVTVDRKRIKRSFCPYCGRKYVYQSDISWEVSNVIEMNNKEKSIVEFICACENCGNKTEFHETFETASVDTNGNVHRYNIENKVRKYFIDK